MNLEPYEKIYKDTDEILGKAGYYMGALVGREKPSDDESLIELRNYAEQFREETNKGVLRTMLIVLKPYREHEIIEPIFKELAETHGGI